MCKNKRATFSSVSIEDNGTTETFYTANVKKKTTWLSIAGLLIAAIVGLLTIRGAVVEGIQGVAGEEFRERLDDFHTVAKPEINDAIDTKIELHRSAGVHPGALTEAEIQQEVSDLQQDIAVVQTTVSQIQGENHHQTELIEELLRKVD